MSLVKGLLPKVKANLILTHDEDDALLEGCIIAAVAYAEAYQKRPGGYYSQGENVMPPTTEQAVIMLSSYFYESRDGGTGGHFSNSVAASQQSWVTINNLLRLEREWQV